MVNNNKLTLSSDQDERDLLDVPVVRHLGVVLVYSVETHLVLQTEHENDGVHPTCKLWIKHNKIKHYRFNIASNITAST